MSYKVAIIIVSDSCSIDPQKDKSGPILQHAFSQHPSGTFKVECRLIHPDDEDQIRRKVQRLIDFEGFRLVITSGGTGFGLRDRTPEALEPLFSRTTPGLTHALTAHSLTKTPLAALSRSLTGIRKPERDSQSLDKSEDDSPESLIIALPGSPKAVQECLEILLGKHDKQGILLHALDLLSGGSGKQKHKEMQATQRVALPEAIVSTSTDTGNERAHHHPSHRCHTCGHHGGADIHTHKAPVPRTRPEDHNRSSQFRTQDPTSAPSLRHRSSPYPIVPMDEALKLIAQMTPDPASAAQPPTRRMPINSKLIGHVLAENVKAKSDLPPGPTTNVDGYAVKAEGNGTPAGDYRVVTLKTLAERFDGELQSGEIFRINTGQGLPVGMDAVVMVEDTELLEVFGKEAGALAGEEKVVSVLAKVNVGENVRPKGSDVKKDAVVLRKGTMLSALGGEIGTLAFLGRRDVLVYRKPRVAILSTGNELKDIKQKNGASPGSNESWGFTVFDANRPGLAAAIDGLGFEVVDLGIVGDDVEKTLAALKKGLDGADVVITTGGTSMGESDLLKPLIERNLRGEIHFGRVAIKPGKPTTFASVDGKLVFALPGNPASALVCFYVFVLPALRCMAGYEAARKAGGPNPWSLPRIPVKLSARMRMDPRPELHRSMVRVEKGGGLVAYSTGSQRSSGMHSMATANALVCVPALSDGPRAIEAGEMAEAILLGPLL